MTARVQNAGLAGITGLIDADGTVKYIQWGVGSAQAASDTDLDSKTGTTEARTAGTISQQTSSVTDDTYRVSGSITALSDGLAITEMGVFDTAGSGTPPSGGDMWLYADFSAINVDTDDSITFTIDTTFS
jgi:hypothetical protein